MESSLQKVIQQNVHKQLTVQLYLMTSCSNFLSLYFVLWSHHDLFYAVLIAKSYDKTFLAFLAVTFRIAYAHDGHKT